MSNNNEIKLAKVNITKKTTGFELFNITLRDEYIKILSNAMSVSIGFIFSRFFLSLISYIVPEKTNHLFNIFIIFFTMIILFIIAGYVLTYNSISISKKSYIKNK